MGSELLSTLMHPVVLARFDEHLARLDSAQDDDVLEFETGCGTRTESGTGSAAGTPFRPLFGWPADLDRRSGHRDY